MRRCGAARCCVFIWEFFGELSCPPAGSYRGGLKGARLGVIREPMDVKADPSTAAVQCLSKGYRKGIGTSVFRADSVQACLCIRARDHEAPSPSTTPAAKHFGLNLPKAELHVEANQAYAPTRAHDRIA